MAVHKGDGPAAELRNLLLSHGVLFNDKADSHVKAFERLVKALETGDGVLGAVDKMRDELSTIRTTGGRAAINVKAIDDELTKISQKPHQKKELSTNTSRSNNIQTSKGETPAPHGTSSSGIKIQPVIDRNKGQKHRDERSERNEEQKQKANETSERNEEQERKLHESIESLKVLITAKDEIIKTQQDTIERERKEMENLKNEKIQLDDDLGQMRRGTWRHKPDKKIQKLVAERNKSQQDLDQALKDREFWMQRVSKLAGAKMTDGNPGIADLSDPNRPIKIAERYGEIYDNQWTNAYECLSETDPKRGDSISRETEAIQKLLKILDDIYNDCRFAAQDQRKILTSAVFMETTNPQSDTTSSPPLEVVKQIKDLQRSTALRTVNCMKMKLLTPELKEKEPLAVLEYMESCIELCWLMVVQDPPVCLFRGDEKKGAKFDGDRFVFYTKSGTQLDYLVWPALLLHENGPMLRKGVVQPL